MKSIEQLRVHRDLVAKSTAHYIQENIEAPELDHETLLKAENLGEITAFSYESIQQFKTNLNLAILKGELDGVKMSQEDIEKAKKDLTKLVMRKVMVTRGGKTFPQIVYVRVNKDESETDFKQEDKVKFEQGGKQVEGVITGLKYHDKFDKFGTATIKGSDGKTYSKSLRDIHHAEGGKKDGQKGDSNGGKKTGKVAYNEKLLNKKDAIITVLKNNSGDNIVYVNGETSYNMDDIGITDEGLRKNALLRAYNASKKKDEEKKDDVFKNGDNVKLKDGIDLVSLKSLKNGGVVVGSEKGTSTVPKFFIIEDKNGDKHSVNPNYLDIDDNTEKQKITQKLNSLLELRNKTNTGSKEYEKHSQEITNLKNQLVELSKEPKSDTEKPTKENGFRTMHDHKGEKYEVYHDPETKEPLSVDPHTKNATKKDGIELLKKLQSKNSPKDTYTPEKPQKGQEGTFKDGGRFKVDYTLKEDIYYKKYGEDGEIGKVQFNDKLSDFNNDIKKSKEDINKGDNITLKSKEIHKAFETLGVDFEK